MLMVRWPWGSRSMRRTRLPSSASAHPRFTAVVVLPTPPFWLATAMTLLKRVLDLCAGTWLRLFNGNTAAQSSSALWTRRGGPGTATPLNGRRGLDSEGGHPSLWNVAAAMDPGRGWRNERVQMVLAQQQIDALGRAKQGVLSQRLVVRESQRLDHVSGVRAHRERLGQIEDLLGEERHLLVDVRVVEVDGVLQRMDRHAAAPGKVLVEVCLEVVEQNGELSGAIVDVADVWEG